MTDRDEEIIEVMARAWVREEAAQMGEPDPWPESTEELGDRAAVSDWRGCASAQLDALRAAGMEVVQRDVLNQMTAAVSEIVDQAGGCDHDVGICYCGLRHVVEEVNALATHTDTAPDGEG